MKQQPWSAPGARSNNLDLIRLVLAAIVIVSHSYPLLYGEAMGSQFEPFALLTRYQATGGSLAVAGFFILSGFLITQSWLSSSGFLNFMWKRILRIYPAFIVMAILCALLFKPLGGASLMPEVALANLPRAALDQLLLYLPADSRAFQGNPLPNAVNGSAWTIKYELWCYLVVALLGVVGALRRPRFLAGLFAAALALNIVNLAGLIPDPLPFENGRTFLLFGVINHYFTFVTLFLAGTTFYVYRAAIPYSAALFGLSIVGLAGSALVGAGLQATLPIFGTYAVLYLGFARIPWQRQSEPARRDDLSYGLYLYGFPVQQVLVAYFAAALTPLSLTLSALAVSAIFATLSWRCVERPFLRLKGRGLHIPPLRVGVPIKEPRAE